MLLALALGGALAAQLPRFEQAAADATNSERPLHDEDGAFLMMGARLKRLTGVDPLTISQTVLTDLNPTAHDAYSLAAAKIGRVVRYCSTATARCCWAPTRAPIFRSSSRRGAIATVARRGSPPWAAGR